MKILEDGSIEGQTFSGSKYKGEYPSPNEGYETYKEYYERCEECRKHGFHLGDLSWSHWQDYLYGCPQGGGQYVQNCIIGNVSDNEWVIYEEQIDDEY